MSIKDDMEDVQEAVINELISDNGLNPLTVGDLQITTAKIADDAVTLAKLGSDVDLGQVNDGAVTPAKLSQAYLPLTGGSVTGNVTFGDNDKAIFGAGSDLHIYHDGINSYIADTGTGRLRLRGNDRVDVYGGDGTKQMAKFRDGAEVALYHNNALKLATTSTGVNVTGTVTADGLTVSGNLQNGDYAANSGATNGYILRQGGSSLNTGATLELLTSSTSRRHHIAFRGSATSGNASGAIRGSISTSSSSTTYATSSDYRLKTDAQPMTGASARVQALNPVNFEWISDGTRVDGFLAHEAQEVVPESVTGTKDALDEEGNPEYQGIDQSKLVPLLTAALQEALTKIEALEVRITNLEA